MLKLKPIPNTELSYYVVDLLAKHGITTACEFLKADITDVCKFTNLNKNIIEELRSRLLEMHKPIRLNALNYYKDSKLKKVVYGFDIESCDNMLGNQKFCNSSIFEICGAAGVGKTQFCFTVLLNIVSNLKLEALYIDTKQDFSGTRIFEMLLARNIKKTECGYVMQRVKVEQTFSLRGVWNTLKGLLNLLESGSRVVAGFKLVILDALPAVWFTMNSDDERLERKYLLCKIANLIHKIAEEYLIAFLLVNLAIQDEDLNIDNQDLQRDIDFSPSPSFTVGRRSTVESISNEMPLKPTLGRYWLSLPRVRLLIKMPNDAEDNWTSPARIVEVTRNVYGPISSSCNVCITYEGIAS